VSRKHVRTAFKGAGAALEGGRWNLPGTPMVYTSATLALAALELLVHLDPDEIPPQMTAIPAEIQANLTISSVDISQLPHNWREYPAPEAVQNIGTEWTRSGASAVLAVPSVVIPSELNYLLNPKHPEFARIAIGRAEPFSLDPRLRKAGRATVSQT
jgi:RES domain-containing protein